MVKKQHSHYLCTRKKRICLLPVKKFNMKTIFTFILFICLCSGIKAQDNIHTDTIKVWGNCGMCKTNIELAADIKGVKSATWDKKTKMLIVTFRTDKTNLSKIEESIAAAGYDTQSKRADDKAYDALHGCCKYERKQE